MPLDGKDIDYDPQSLWSRERVVEDLRKKAAKRRAERDKEDRDFLEREQAAAIAQTSAAIRRQGDLNRQAEAARKASDAAHDKELRKAAVQLGHSTSPTGLALMNS
jgi:hypothetical protein